MKFRNNFLPVMVVCANLSGHGHAAIDQHWNVGSAGGDGVWGTGPGDKNWNAIAGAPSGNITWPDTLNDVAVFQDAFGGTVTVLDPVQTAGIRQIGASYTLNANMITLVPDSVAAHPFINVQTNPLTINSALAGTSGLQKTGAANLLLTNANPYTGTTSVSAGTLTLTGSLDSTTILIASGANLLDQAGGLASTTALTNAGFLTINAADTIASLTNNAGTVNGTRTLTVTGATIFTGGTLAAPLIVTGSGGGTFTNAAISGTFNGTTALDGATVSGRVSGNITSTGNVLVSGTIGGRSLNVIGGTLNLTGTSNHETVIIRGGATTIVTGRLSAKSSVTNDGLLEINESKSSSGSYIQNATGTLAGISTLTANQATLNGGLISGNLSAGTTTSTGDVLISGTVGGSKLNVTGGTLNLTGTSTHRSITIEAPGKLIDTNGGLYFSSDIINRGALTIDATEVIRKLTNLAGTVNGTGTLIVTGATIFTGGTLAAPLIVTGSGGGTFTNASISGTFNGTTALDGATVSGTINGNTTSSGAVSFSGRAIAGDFNIVSGVLTNTGALSATTRFNITAGATLIANGTQNYALLTTSESGAGNWQGNLNNLKSVAPGSVGSLGSLAVTGNFANTSTGVLHFDLATASHDRLTASGSATFAGVLDLNQLAAPAPFIPLKIVAASSYNGNFTSLTENIEGAVWFNPGNGTVTRLALPSGSTLFGTTANQTSTWISLYDDVIDPGITNITTGSNGNLAVTSGLAAADNPDLLWALTASITPSGLDQALLNRLSPAVYRGFQDYAIQSTRSHQRAALTAPSLAGRSPQPSSSKDSAKATPPVIPFARDWEFFAALDFFDVQTDNSTNQADYQADAIGFIAGARTMITDRIRVGGYFAGNDGTVDGALIDTDAAGWSLGMFTHVMLEEKSQTLLSAGVSYGAYCFSGNRDSVSAASTGWSPGHASFEDVESDALELFIGVQSVAFHTDRFRFIPSAGLRYVTGSMNGFTEKSGGAAGAPIALKMDENAYREAMVEIGIRVEADLTNEITVRGLLGCSVDLLDETEVLSSRFEKGSRPMNADAEGLSGDVLSMGLGASYQFSKNTAVSLDWRAEFRSGADVQSGLSLTSTFRF